jgi:hypothetical protein
MAMAATVGVRSLVPVDNGNRKKPEKCFQGGNGATAPPFWQDYFQPTRKGGGGLTPPKYLVPQRKLIAIAPQNATKRCKMPQNATKHRQTPQMCSRLLPICHKTWANAAKHHKTPQNAAKHRKTPQNTAKRRKTLQNAKIFANW